MPARRWTLEAAEAICAGEGVTSDEVLDRLGHLVDHSLVVADEQAGKVRYRLLETARQDAAEKLEDAGESVSTRARHRDWFTAEAESGSFYPSDPRHLEWMAEELDNLRAALRWSIQRGEAEAGLRLARATAAFWFQRGQFAEGRAWFAELLALPGAASTAARAFALSWAGWLAMMHGASEEAKTLSADGLALARQLGDTWEIANALQHAGAIAGHLGELAVAESLSEEGLSISRTHAHAVLEFYHQWHLAVVSIEQGNPARAETLGNDIRALARRLGLVRGVANSLYALGRAASIRGDYAAGRSLLEEALARYREYADWLGIGITLRALADLSLEQGEVRQARVLFAESLSLAGDSGATLEVARGLEGLAGASLGAHPDCTVRLAGTASALREGLTAVPYPWERNRLEGWLRAAQSTLGEEAYIAAWTEGRGTPVEQAVALALSEVGFVGALQASAGVGDDASERLSMREREVAQLVARGHSNREIAEQLVIAPRTADTHVGHILRLSRATRGLA